MLMMWWRFDLQKCTYLFSQLPLPSSNSEKDFLSFVSPFFSWFYFSLFFSLLLAPKPQSHADWVADQFKQQGFRQLNVGQQECCGLSSTLSVATQLRIQVWRQEECGNRILAAHTLLTLSFFHAFFSFSFTPVIFFVFVSHSLSFFFPSISLSMLPSF